MNGYFDSKLATWEGGRRLTITLPPGRRAMEYQIEMIANNDVFGLLSFRYLTSDGKPCFHYDVNGLVTLREYLDSYGQGIRFLAETLMDISVAIGGLDKFLLEEKCLLFDIGLIFIDPSRKGVKLVYLPVEPPEDKRGSFYDLVMELIGNIHPEDATGKLFCRRIIEEVKKSGFKYEAFTDFLLDILCFSDEKNSETVAGEYQQAAAQRSGAGHSGAAKSGMLKSDALKSGMLKSGSLPERTGGIFGGFSQIMKQRFGVNNGEGKRKKPAETGYRNGAPDNAAPRGALKSGALLAGAAGYDGGAASGKSTAIISVKNAQILPPLLAATAIAVAYFSILSFIPDNIADGTVYRSAALIIAIGAELLLFKHFIVIDAAEEDAKMKKPAKNKEFADAVQAASSIFDTGAAANAATANTAQEDLWAGSAAKADIEPEADAAPDCVGSDANDEKMANGSRSADKALESFPDSVPQFSCPDKDWETSYPDIKLPDGKPPDGHLPDSFLPDDYPPTEILSCDRRVDAMLLIRETMREFGVTLTGSEFTIGRKKEYSDLVLDNPAVGKTHAKLVKKDELWYVKDLFSRNGTYLNNLKLDCGGERILNTSDMITIANVDMLFSLTFQSHWQEMRG